MDELWRIYYALLSSDLIVQKASDRIQFYEYPESGDVDGLIIVIDPLSEPKDSDYGDNEAIAEKFPIQVDVWSKNPDDNDAVMKQVNKVLRGIGYTYDGAGPKEYDSGVYRSVRRYIGTYYTSEFQGAQ